MELRTITRTALGRVAKLGDLYDARCDKFCDISILKDGVPESVIYCTDNHFSDTKYFHSDKFSDIFQILDVESELKLSVLSGLISLEGSGRYFKDAKSSKRAVRCTLMHNICTKVEELSIFNDTLKDCIKLDALQQEATHVVIGISWGANLFITAESPNQNNKGTLQVVRAVLAQLKKANLEIQSNGVEYSKGESSNEKELSLNIYGDVLPDGDLPKTIDGAIELMKNLPAVVQKVNDGKGNQLQYTMLPVDVLKSYFNIHMKAHTVVKSLNLGTILQFVSLFDAISEANQQLNDLHGDVVEHECCVLNTTRKILEDFKSNADITEASLRSQLLHLLVEIRSGRAESCELHDIRQKYEEDPNSALRILNTIPDQFADVSNKINLYKLLVIKHGVIFVPNTISSLDKALLPFFGKDAYMLFSKTKTKTVDKERWSKQMDFFLSLTKNAR